MTDTAKEWLESLYARRPTTPEADWAKDILDRLDEAEGLEDAEVEDKLSLTRAELRDAQIELAEMDGFQSDILEALGAGDPDEAIEMARAMRAAFTGE